MVISLNWLGRTPSGLSPWTGAFPVPCSLDSLLKSRFKSWRKLGFALLVLFALVPLLGLFFSKQILSVDSGNVQGEVMVVLGGETIHRPARAQELYQQGAASRILITGAGDCQEVRIALAGKGVPPAALQIECESHNTQQNARFSIPLLRAQGARRVIIVTSWFHSRRALKCFRHQAPDIDFVSRPTIADQPKSHWPNKYERGWVLTEYAKLLYYWVRCGVSPW